MPRGRTHFDNWLAVLLCVALLTACGPTSAVPGAPTAAAVEPPHAIVHDSFSIAVPIGSADDDRDNRHAFLQRLQSLLQGQGWKVNLIDLPYASSGDQSDEDAMLDIIQTQTSAGKCPDAWLVYKTLAKGLRAKGLTQDMATVMPMASSNLWDLCKGAFADGADGVPVVLTTNVANQPIGLQISTTQLQAYGSPIANIDDLLTFLEKRPDASILMANIYALAGAWAAQQGYYSLADYGLPPFLYARKDDADCTPVPLEDINGFDEFFLRWTALWQDGRLHDANDGFAQTYSGVLSVLGSANARMVQQAMGLQDADVEALPLEGCTRVPPEDTPIFRNMFAVSTTSQQASAVAGFAQWALLDRQGYDLCTLGQRDTDYRLDGERVEYLNAGIPLADTSWKYDPKHPAFYWYRNMLVGYSGMLRIEKGSAGNLEQVLDGIKIESLPITRVKALHGDLFDRKELFAAARAPYQDVLGQRTQDIACSTYDGAPQRAADKVLKQLRDNRPKLDPLILDLKKRLQQMLDDPDGEPIATVAAVP